MSISLPPEVWNLIAQYCAYGEREGEHWIVEKRPWQSNRKWTALRALAQVNRAARRSAMPILWTYVELRAINENFFLIQNLGQLFSELSIGSSALPTAASYMNSLLLQFKLEEKVQTTDGQGEVIVAKSQKRMDFESLKLGATVSVDTESDKYIRCLHPDSGPTYLEELLTTLSVSIASCSKLQSFIWSSPCLPPPAILSAVGELPAIQTMNLLSREIHSSKSLTIKEWTKALQASTRSTGSERQLTRATLGLRLHDPATTLPLDVSEAGVSIVDWLVTMPKLRHIILRFPDLTYYCWTLPLWAHISRLDLKAAGSAESRTGPISFKAAQSFSSILQSKVWPKVSFLFLPLNSPRKMPCSALILVADLICACVREEEALRVWTCFFTSENRWPPNTTRNQQGHTILCKVAEVFIKKMTNRPSLVFDHIVDTSAHRCLCRKVLVQQAGQIH
ncbi:unnamed protein product [Sympodiomycopsis kandeliae]